MKKVVVLLLFSAAALGGSLELPSVFSDHMILQREQPVPVWGRAEPGSTVTVEFAAQTKTTTAGADGKWRVDLDPMVASSEPCQLQVSSFEFQVSFTNVLVGEVWFCSGQSNMQMPLRGADNGGAAGFLFPGGVCGSLMGDLGCAPQVFNGIPGADAVFWRCAFIFQLTKQTGRLKLFADANKTNRWAFEHEQRSGNEKNNDRSIRGSLRNGRCGKLVSDCSFIGLV